MSWKYRGDSTLENARRELGVDLADDPLAQHLALQIEAAELALERRVDWLVEKRDEELEKRRAETEETLEDCSFTSPAANVIEARPLASGVGRVPPARPVPAKPACPDCGAVLGHPHLIHCPRLK